MGGVRGRMMNGLTGNFHRRFLAERRPGVGIAIEVGEMAAGYVHTDSVPLLKDVAGADEIDLKLVHLVRLERSGMT